MPACLRICSLLFFLCSGALSFSQTKKYLTTGGIEYRDDNLKNLLPENAKIEIVGAGFQHIEGPVWVRDSSMLLFSDTKARIIYRWRERDGTTRFLSPAGFTGRLPYSEEPGTNGLAIAKDSLLICEHGDRRVALFSLGGKYGLKTVTDNYRGKRYNSPNDITVNNRGTIYFTDPPYGLPQKDNDLSKQTLFSGVYCITANGSVTVLIDSLLYPNGIAFSPGGKQMYLSVSDSLHPRILVYDVVNDSTLANGRIFFEASHLSKEDVTQKTDGLKVDTEGNVWAAGPGGLLILSPDGKLLGRIHTGEVIANCAWGENGSTLFLMGNTFLYRIKTKAKGIL